MADNASLSLLKRAAAHLALGWLSCFDLGVALYGEPAPEKKGRMNIMVRARRPINRLLKLGLLAMRVNSAGVREYMLLPDGVEALLCQRE